MISGRGKIYDDRWRVTVARNVQEIEAIRPVWEQLQENELSPVPNSHIDRFMAYICAKEGSAQPYTLLFQYNNCPKAMVICRIEKNSLKCKIGYKTLFQPSLRFLSVVYGGVLGQPTDDVYRIIIKELKNVLKRGEADVIFCSRLRTDSKLYRIVRESSGLLYRDNFSVAQPNWRTKIPDSLETFYQSLSSHRRRYISYYSKRLEKKYPGQIRFECYRKEEDLDYIISLASNISAQTYKNALDAGFSDNNITRSVLQQSAKNRWLCAYVLYVGDEPCAFEYGVKYGKTFFAEYMGFDPKWKAFSLGTIMWLKVIEDLSKDPDVNLLDYGFGDAVYKQRFGTESYPEVYTMVFAGRVKPVIINFTWSCFVGISHLLSNIAARAGFTNRVKKWWRKKLQQKSGTKTR